MSTKNECCDGECHHDDCCGKVPENCTHKPTESWEGELRELMSTADYYEHKDLEDFIRELLHSQREELCGRFLQAKNFLKKQYVKGESKEYVDGYNNALYDMGVQAIKNND